MKKTALLLSVLIIASCSTDVKNEITTPTSGKRWVCDSITESWVDSLGVEHMKTTSQCDSVEITK